MAETTPILNRRTARAHVREFLADTVTPLGLYQRLAQRSPYRFLFESVTGGEQVSRYSLMGAGPAEVYRVYADRLEIQRRGEESQTVPGPPLGELRRRLESIDAPSGPLPFMGGYVGYFGWDLIRLLERLPDRPPDPFDLPIALLLRFDDVVVFDHAHQRVVCVANEIDGETTAQQAKERLEQIAELLHRRGSSGAQSLPEQKPPPLQPTEPTLSDEQYREAVRRAKEYIVDGDIFQVVLARRWSVPAEITPQRLYRALRMVNPSPYMVLWETPNVSLVGASPEMLVRKTGSRLEVRPIAGTRPRGATPAADQQLAEEMLSDPKERAEHVMLVDLGRNDLGRAAGPGAVEVDSFMEVEYYSHVMHIVSNVAATLAPGKTALDALFSCFPAGTLSGAPKIRAMEIIDELEPEARGVYGGAVGYLSYSGDLDTCIAIRTLVLERGHASVTAGAGIVADSDPEREEQETRDKAAALMQAVALAQTLEDES